MKGFSSCLVAESILSEYANLTGKKNENSEHDKQFKVDIDNASS
jgi:hypothetical protein